MCKQIMIFLLLVNMLFLTSCSISGLMSNDNESDLHPMLESRLDELNKNTEEGIADAMMEKIISIIEDKDKEAIKALFSKKSLDETGDIDSQVDYLFEFVQGDVMSWERELWHSGEKTREGGEKVVISSWYLVETDEDKYLFFLSDTTKNTIDPDDQGVSTIQVIKEEDAEITQWQDMFLKGIHVFTKEIEVND